MEIFAAIIGVISTIVGLVVAIVSKRRVVEHKYIYDNYTKSISCYDNHFWVFISIVFLYPLSVYALVQSNTISNTLIDTIYNFALISILLVVVISIISLIFYESKNQKLNNLYKKIDLTSFIIILTSYISLNIYLIYNAINS
jgi:hypothetical protein